MKIEIMASKQKCSHHCSLILKQKTEKYNVINFTCLHYSSEDDMNKIYLVNPIVFYQHVFLNGLFWLITFIV